MVRGPRPPAPVCWLRKKRVKPLVGWAVVPPGVHLV